MNKTTITIISILGLLLILLLFGSNSGEDRKDWRPSFNTKDKTPLGLFIFDKEVDTFFTVYVERYKDKLQDYFYEGVFEDSVLYDYCLLNINASFETDKEQIINLCDFARIGNSVFLSAYSFPEALMDSLNLELHSVPYVNFFQLNPDTTTLSLTDSLLYDDGISGTKTITGSFFESLDSTSTEVLGIKTHSEVSKPNFVKVRFGKGKFFIHLEPAIFSNYHFMKDYDYKHVENVLSFIPDFQEVVWLLDKQTSKVISDSPLRFIMSQRSLKWAWFLLLSGILAFILFNIRRSQRIIPIIPTQPNTSVEFAKTIGNLYRQEGNMNNIVSKKIIYFLERIRSEFHIQTDELDEKFIHSLHTKSGKDIKVIRKLVLLINRHRQFDYTCTIHELQQLNDTIENFYKS